MVMSEWIDINVFDAKDLLASSDNCVQTEVKHKPDLKAILRFCKCCDAFGSTNSLHELNVQWELHCDPVYGKAVVFPPGSARMCDRVETTGINKSQSSS